MGYLVSSLAGFLFGFAMNKARVIEPMIIQDQMVMSRFVMLKLFLTASGTSALSFALLYCFKSTRSNVLNAINNMSSLMNRGYLPFIVGGLLLGAGLDIAGTCPGMIYVELGALIQHSGWTFLGCLFGTFVYTLLQPQIEKLSTKTSSHSKTVMELTGKEYPLLAVLFAGIMYGIVFLVESFRPWRTDVHTVTPMALDSYAWSPVVSGVIVGLLQLPLNGLLGKMIGTSMSYVTLLAQVYDKHPELKNNKQNWWQVCVVGGSILGSYVSSFLYFNRLNVYDSSVQGVSPLKAFIGGTLLLIGAKTMHGCTSGHGLSGMPLMSIPSIVATICIFAGGITTGILFKFLYFVWLTNRLLQTTLYHMHYRSVPYNTVLKMGIGYYMKKLNVIVTNNTT